jgi:transcription elongation factor GreB
LTKKIEAAEIVEPKSIQSDRILFGATVKLQDDDGKEKIYQIVGEDESNVETGKISWKSPLAKALLGKKQDDEITLKRPAGEKVFLILKISYF